MILDMTAGLQEMWFTKWDKETIYLDKRKKLPDGMLNPKYNNQPLKITLQGDNSKLPFKDNIFDLVLFDPPHNIGKWKGFYTDLYSILEPGKWQKHLYLSTREALRVLKYNGFLIFKWNNRDRSLQNILTLFPWDPLFGTNVSGKGGNSRSRTYFVVFQKR